MNNDKDNFGMALVFCFFSVVTFKIYKLCSFYNNNNNALQISENEFLTLLLACILVTTLYKFEGKITNCSNKLMNKIKNLF